MSDYRDKLRRQQQACRREIEAGCKPPVPKPKPGFESYVLMPDVWRTIAEGVAGKADSDG